MNYKVGIDKKQITLIPVSLDEYVSEDHICRVIYAFINQLDMIAQKIDFFVKTSLPPLQGIFFEGEIFDAYIFISKLKEMRQRGSLNKSIKLDIFI